MILSSFRLKEISKQAQYRHLAYSFSVDGGQSDDRELTICFCPSTLLTFVWTGFLPSQKSFSYVILNFVWVVTSDFFFEKKKKNLLKNRPNLNGDLLETKCSLCFLSNPFFPQPLIINTWQLKWNRDIARK